MSWDRRPFFCGLIFAAAISLTPGAGWPQEAESDRLDTVDFDVIVVTGTRRGSPVRELAGNTARIETDEIDLVRQDHVGEIVNRVAGVGLHRGNGQEHLTAIRSPVLTAGAGAGSFLFMEDGIPLRAAGFANVNGLFEANSEQAGGIEVVRGPGSAFYGSNAQHGLINVLSRAPSDAVTHEAQGSAGPHDLFHTGLTSSGTFGRHGYRVGFNTAHDGGWRFASGFDQQKSTLRYDYNGPKDDIRVVVSGQNLNQETAGFVTGFKAYKDDVLKKGNPNPDAFRDAKSARASVRWDRTLEDGSQISVTPYLRFTEMTFLMHFLPSQAVEKNGHRSAGFQSAYYRDLDGGHRIILGTDLEYTSGYLSEVQSLPSLPFGGYDQGVHYNYEINSWVVAPYFHTEWQVLPKTRVTLGLRYEHTRYDYNDLTGGGLLGKFQRVPDRVSVFNNFSPKFGVVHHLRDDHSLYFNYARGRRAPQTTDLYRLESNQIAGQVTSETLDSIEFGVRGRVQGVTYDLAAYYMEKDNFFFRDVDGFNVPNGKTRHRGIELSLYRPFLKVFDATVAFTYAKHTYNFDNSVSSVSNSTEAITDGDDVDTSPRTLGNARLGWNLFDNGRMELEWAHMGRYYLDASNQHKYPGYETVNFRARWELTRYVDINARVTNLLDTEYAERADFFRGTHRYFPGEERAGHVALTLRY